MGLYKYREEFGPQKFNRGVIEGIMWPRQTSVAKNLTYCSAQFMLESKIPVYIGIWFGIAVFLIETTSLVLCK